MVNYEICYSKNFATMEKLEGLLIEVFPKQSNFKLTVQAQIVTNVYL